MSFGTKSYKEIKVDIDQQYGFNRLGPLEQARKDKYAEKILAELEAQNNLAKGKGGVSKAKLTGGGGSDKDNDANF
jgi:hypothetical protein